MFNQRIIERNAGFGCLVQRSTTQSITSATETAVIFDTIVHNDFRNFGDLSTSTTKIIMPFNAWYFIWATVQWGFASGTAGYVAIKLNSTNGGSGTGTAYIAERYLDGADAGQVNVCGAFRFNQNDYIEVYVQQNTGSNQNIDSGAYFGAIRLGF